MENGKLFRTTLNQIWTWRLVCCMCDPNITWCQKMGSFKPPGVLNLSGNLRENWRRWVQQFDLYLTASGKVKERENVQCAILLHLIGEDALEIYNTFTFAEGESRDEIEILKKKFEDYANPRKNTVFERYKFWECKQQEGETIDQFITELKTRAKSCEFGEQRESMIRDRLVFGVSDTRLKERLLRESSELTLERAASLCRAAEESKRQLKHLGKDPEKKEVHPVRKGGKPPTAKAKAGDESPFNCSKCGTRHLPKHCPAFQKMCHLCKRKGHFFKCCPQRRINSRGVHEVTECAASSSESEDSPGPIDFFIGTITGGEINSAWFSSLDVEGTLVKFKLDTGAEVNVLPARIYSELKNKPPVNENKCCPFFLWWISSETPG